MNIPCLDINKQYLSIKAEILAKTEEVFDSNAFSGGPYVAAFEKDFAAFCESKFSLGCNNGTTALHLALLALGIKSGDEVILPANTFIATAWAISYVGAIPVFVDNDPNTWEIDVNQIEAKITSKTKAIIGVHLYGQPFDIDAVRSIAEKHQLFVVEDAAQAQGARYKGKPVGTFGDIGCFSFYPGKNLGAFGEAGGLTMQDESYAKHIMRLRNHGMEQRYYHEEIGYNYRMDGLQGAILSIKLKYLANWNSRRKEIAQKYLSQIVNPLITMQHQPVWSDSVFHLFVVTTPDRENFAAFLAKNGIQVGYHYPVPCHLQNAYKYLGHSTGDFPNAEYLAAHCVSLPMFAELTDEEVSHVIDIVNQYK
ncbi:DegT/DnrJ/EryC1/StrS family aminotransferase [Aquirufa echingensis]|uniref:DegT/DnrJ/EryC1/StrS family aminotransferase n=1 Tax=Aquirufa echingensis TaxID=3096516 RepID=A0ABW6D1A4_9BACT